MRKSRRRTKFTDLSIPHRIGIVLLGTVQVSLLIAAQVDIQRRPAAQINVAADLPAQHRGAAELFPLGAAERGTADGVIKRVAPIAR